MFSRWFCISSFFFFFYFFPLWLLVFFHIKNVLYFFLVIFVLISVNLLYVFDLWFSSVQLLSRVWLFATPWTTARQASLSITNSWSLLKPMSTESVMLTNHLILCRPLLLSPNPSQQKSLFQWVNSSHEVTKVLEFQLQHQSFQWTPRTDLL